MTIPESLGPQHPAVICPHCGKAGFASRRGARRAAATIAGRTGGRWMRAYRCPLSPGLWHLTSQPKRGQREETSHTASRTRR